MPTIEPIETYLLLKKLVEGKSSYQPTIAYTNNKVFTPDPLLNNHKLEFVRDTTLDPK